MALRIGIVGTGDIGRIHLKSLSKLPDVSVVIAKGRNPMRAEILAEEFGAEVASNFEDMLRDDSISGVSVCVPNDLHARFSIQALESGKAVLCEKPIALSLDEAQSMIDASERAEKPLRVGHVVRFWSEYRIAREIIRQGSLGSVQVLSARRLIPLLRSVRGEEGWRHEGNRSGGAILDLLIHDIDFALWTFGMPVAVTSRGVLAETGTYEHAFTLLDFEDRPTVGIESSFMLQGNPVVMDFRAIGEECSLEFAFTESDFAMHDIRTGENDRRNKEPESLVLYRWGRPKEVLSTQIMDPISAIFDSEMEAFVGVVRGEERPDLASPFEALEALRVAIAARQSCLSGKRISLVPNEQPRSISLKPDRSGEGS